MFEAWGRILYRRRRLTLIVTLVLVAFAAVWGTGVFGKLSSGQDFTPPSSQSQWLRPLLDMLSFLPVGFLIVWCRRAPMRRAKLAAGDLAERRERRGRSCRPTTAA